MNVVKRRKMSDKQASTMIVAIDLSYEELMSEKVRPYGICMFIYQY